MIYLLLLSILVGGIRPFLVGRKVNKHLTQSYQALAHILVGVLLAVWWVQDDRLAGFCLGLLTVIEVICAFTPLIHKEAIILADCFRNIDDF